MAAGRKNMGKEMMPCAPKKTKKGKKPMPFKKGGKVKC